MFAGFQLGPLQVVLRLHDHHGVLLVGDGVLRFGLQDLAVHLADFRLLPRVGFLLRRRIEGNDNLPLLDRLAVFGQADDRQVGSLRRGDNDRLFAFEFSSRSHRGQEVALLDAGRRHCRRRRSIKAQGGEGANRAQEHEEPPDHQAAFVL